MRSASWPAAAETAAMGIATLFHLGIVVLAGRRRQCASWLPRGGTAVIRPIRRSHRTCGNCGARLRFHLPCPSGNLGLHDRLSIRHSRLHPGTKPKFMGS
jgi:hypothetical protein